MQTHIPSPMHTRAQIPIPFMRVPANRWASLPPLVPRPAVDTALGSRPQSPSSPCPKVIFPRLSRRGPLLLFPLLSAVCSSNHLHSEDRPLSTFRGELVHPKARFRFPYGNHLNFHPHPSHTPLPLHISIVFGELFAPLLVQVSDPRATHPCPCYRRHLPMNGTD
jgi:hypothetical protein